MPQVTVYIREEDLEAWKALGKKSEFIHSALKGVSFDITAKEGSAYTIRSATGIMGVAPHVTQTKRFPDLKKPEPFVPHPPDPETGYPCCLKARPCKHWQWDGNKSAYVNTLTGKEREAEL